MTLDKYQGPALSGLVAITSHEEMRELILSTGSRVCFGMRCKLSNGHEILTIFHGCSDLPHFEDIVKSWERVN